MKKRSHRPGSLNNPLPDNAYWHGTGMGNHHLINYLFSFIISVVNVTTRTTFSVKASGNYKHLIVGLRKNDEDVETSKK